MEFAVVTPRCRCSHRANSKVFGRGIQESEVTESRMARPLGQFHLLPIILPCNLLASFIARTISRESLYAIASSEPA
jgi:hypothetical protein